ncbi:flagellin [Wolinella succinogenes]|uniref:flagellin n=1 Tax=Wolinella succinogenes TaxID=844 RepID=UPI002FCAB429
MKIGQSQTLSQNINTTLEKSKAEEKKALENLMLERALGSQDGASLMSADALVSQISSMMQGVKNSNDAIGMLQIADGALGSVTDSTVRLSELSVAMGNPALSSDQRSMIESEAKALTQSMNDAMGQATFNGKSAFGSSMSFVTSDSSLVDMTLNAPNTAGLSVLDQDSIQDFMKRVGQERANIGSTINGIHSLVDSHLTTVVNLKNAESNLQDNDVAENYNELNTAKIREGAALYAQSFNAQYLQSKLGALLG